MNILCTRFPLESAEGGAENQTMQLMQGLITAGNAVSFAGSCPVINMRCIDAGIPRVELDIGPPPVTKFGAISFVWRKVSMRAKLNRLLNQFSKLDAICMISLSEKILLTPLALKKGIRVIWIEHDMVGNWLTKNPSLPVLKELSKKVTTVCVSDLSANIFRELGYANVIAIPNGVPSPPKDFVPHEFDETLRLGCIARLSKEKGVDLLAEAVRRCENTTLLINGKGNVHIPSTPTITVKAEVPNINDVYAQIDVLILPSRQEDPFGLVVAEAMLRGIAVICTDACGIASYLRHEHDALIVRAGSESALTEAINTLQDTVVRMALARNGKQTAEQMFTTTQMVKKYTEVLMKTV